MASKALKVTKYIDGHLCLHNYFIFPSCIATVRTSASFFHATITKYRIKQNLFPLFVLSL